MERIINPETGRKITVGLDVFKKLIRKGYIYENNQLVLKNAQVPQMAQVPQVPRMVPIPQIPRMVPIPQIPRMVPIPQAPQIPRPQPTVIPVYRTPEAPLSNPKINEESRIIVYRELKGIDESRLDIIKLLGRGSFGTVELAKDRVSGLLLARKSVRNDKEAKDEVTVGEKVTQYVLRDICPHFPFLYSNYLLRGQLVILNEVCAGDLNSIAKLGTLQLKSMLFQVLSAVHALEYYDYTFHNDIKSANVLYQRSTQGQPPKTYEIYGKHYECPDSGYLAILNDYGVSLGTYQPKFKYQSLDTRDWRIQSKFTDRQSGKDLYSRKDIPVFFLGDVVDTLGMFLGTKRLSQDGNHIKIPTTPEFDQWINQIIQPLGGKAGINAIQAHALGLTTEGNIVKKELRHFFDAGLAIQSIFHDWETRSKPNYTISHQFYK